MAVPNLDLLRQIEEEMNRQSARLQSMQLELHRQGSDIQSLKRVAAESRAQQELEEQDEKMRASHQSMQSAMHDHLASHAAAQRKQLDHLQEILQQHKVDMAELQGDVDETPLVAAGPVETAQPPVEASDARKDVPPFLCTCRSTMPFSP